MARVGLLAGLLLLTLTAQAQDGPGARKGEGALTDFRVTAALQNMQALAQAEETCAIQTGYFVALEALNDTGNDLSYIPWDFINYGGGSYVLRPDDGYFLTSRRTFSFDFLGFPYWGGPYLTYQSGTTQTGDTPYDKGSLLDPWGNPYYFYSPLGLLRGDTGKVSAMELYGDAFGTYTIVSHGPDGVMSDDDLARSLGVGISYAVLTSLRGPGVTAGTGAGAGKPGAKTAAAHAPSLPLTFTAKTDSPVTLRGQNLGAPAADAHVTFDGAALDTVTTWTTRAIQFTFPPALGGKSGALAIQRGAASTNALSVSITAPPNAITEWALYE